MGGVLYRAVADKNPPDAVARIRGDSMGAEFASARGRYSEGFLNAIEWSLKLDEKQRPQSVAQWKEAVLAERRVHAQMPPPATERRALRTERVAPAPVAPPQRSRWPIIAVVCLVALAGFGMWKKQRDARNEAERAAAATAERDAEVARQREERQKLEELRRRAAARAAATPAPAPAPASAAATAPAPAPDPAPSPTEPSARQDRLERMRAEALAEFKSADADRDGFLSRGEAARFPALAQHFQRIDADGDGRVSQREFLQAKRAVLERRLNKQGS